METSLKVPGCYEARQCVAGPFCGPLSEVKSKLHADTRILKILKPWDFQQESIDIKWSQPKRKATYSVGGRLPRPFWIPDDDL